MTYRVPKTRNVRPAARRPEDARLDHQEPRPIPRLLEHSRVRTQCGVEAKRCEHLYAQLFCPTRFFTQYMTRRCRRSSRGAAWLPCSR